MDIKTYLRSTNPDERNRVAREAGTTVAYLYQIAGGHRTPGPKMALAIERATSGQVTRSELRPDLWEDAAA